jgi:hypothetical protein
MIRVHELIERLQQYDPDSRVRLVDTYGNVSGIGDYLVNNVGMIAEELPDSSPVIHITIIDTLDAKLDIMQPGMFQ